LRASRSHTYTNGNCYIDANSNCYIYRHAHNYTKCDANSHSYDYSQANTQSQAERNPKAAAYPAAAAVDILYEKETHCSICFLQSARSDFLRSRMFGSNRNFAWLFPFGTCFEAFPENADVC
jgi:hypothetical protein